MERLGRWVPRRPLTLLVVTPDGCWDCGHAKASHDTALCFECEDERDVGDDNAGCAGYRVDGFRRVHPA